MSLFSYVSRHTALLSIPAASLFFLVAPTAFAATFTWDNGGGDNLWSTAANWSSNAVPNSTGSVVFNTTSTADVTVDVNVSILSLTINSGYTGTITQSGAIMVGTGGYIQGGGTFNGGSAPILVQRNLTLTGGTLRSTSGILSISGSFVRSGGTFTHNSGTVSLAGPADRTLTMSSTLNRLDIESTSEEDLVGYWKLDETSGLKVFDSSGFGHGAPFSNVTISADVAPVSFADTRSFRFSRSASEVHVPTTFSLGTSATVAFWMKLPLDNTLNGAVGLQMAISDEVGLGNRYRVYVTSGQLKIDGDACPFSGTTYPNDGGWHHIAFAKSASDSSCSIFVDGSSVGTVTAGASVRTGTGMRIGNYSGFNIIGIIGHLDDVRAYNRALSASEVASLADGLYPVRTGGSTVTTSTNTTAASAFNIWNGTFNLDGNTLTAQGSFLNYDTLSISGGTFAYDPSNVLITDSAFTEANSVTMGTTAYFTVTDLNENLDGITQDTINVTVTSSAGDSETVTLTETTTSSGIFRGSLMTYNRAVATGDHALQSLTDGTITLSYTDAETLETTTDSAAFLIATSAGTTATSTNTTSGGGRRSSPTTTTTTDSPSTPSPSDSPSPQGGPDTDTLPLFHDIPRTSWFADAVTSLIQQGVIDGYKDPNGNPLNMFGPADPVTIGQILKIALLSSNHNLPSSLPLPKNPTANDWSAPYIAFGELLGIDLASETSQRPATRGEVIHALIQLFDVDLSIADNPFSDLQADHIYNKDILTAVRLGVVKGDDKTSTVRPDDLINRAEVATLVVRIMDKVHK